LKYIIPFLALIALMTATFRSTFAVTLHTLSLLVTRTDSHATGEPEAILTRRSPQTDQHVESSAVNAPCHAESKLAELGSTNQDVPSQNGWNVVFKEWRQQVRRIERCAES